MGDGMTVEEYRKRWNAIPAHERSAMIVEWEEEVRYLSSIGDETVDELFDALIDLKRGKPETILALEDELASEVRSMIETDAAERLVREWAERIGVAEDGGPLRESLLSIAEFHLAGKLSEREVERELEDMRADPEWTAPEDLGRS